jgi:hypothetical protein
MAARRARSPAARRASAAWVELARGVETARFAPEAGPLRVRRSASRSPAGLAARFARALSSVFVPEGYPASVREGYLAFQAWDSVQGLCSYLRGVLSTRAILSGLGVGHESASALAATTQWVYRDGAGMLGGLVFAWAGAPWFDLNVKRWRLLADVAVDLALTLELASPLLCPDDGGAAARSCFTASVCLANVLKAMCGVAAGATRAVITAHFARAGNMADVQAKEGSQETAVSLAGMVLGLQLARLVEQEQHRDSVWLLFAALTLVHLLANLLAVRALRLASLNGVRLALLVEEALRGGDAPALSVARVNAAEPVLGAAPRQIRVGVPLSALPDAAARDAALAQLEHAPCAALPPPRGAGSPDVCLALRHDAGPRDIVAAVFDAAAAQSASAGREEQRAPSDGASFVAALERAGWDLGSLYLWDEKYRLEKSTRGKQL